MSVLTPELRAWLTPGLAGMLAVVDASGQPQTARVFALHPHGDRDAIDVYLLDAGARPVVQRLATPVRAALNVIDVPSYRSRTLKGWCTAAAATGEDERTVRACLDAMSAAFTRIGMPGDVLERILSHAAGERTWVRVVLEVDCAFDQSPKPGAGAPL